MLSDPYWTYSERSFWRRAESALSSQMKTNYGEVFKRFYDMKLSHPNMRHYNLNYPLKARRCSCLPVHRVLGRPWAYVHPEESDDNQI